MAAGLVANSGCSPGSGRSPVPETAAERAKRPRFSDVASAAGVLFRWGHGGKTPLTALDSFGCGCAFLDANGDGLLDVLLVGEPTCALFLNRGGGRFEEVTQSSGLARLRGPWKGCAVGDYDGDGRPDIVLTGYNVLKLLHNEEDAAKGRGGEGATRESPPRPVPASPCPFFRDVTASSGLRATGWGSSAGFMDLDGDGYPELLVGNYVIYNEHTPHYCELAPGVKSGCPPSTYTAQYPRLYRNNRNGTFTDVTARTGVGAASGKALVFAFADYDGDGRMDFYVGNDGTPANLFHNDGGLRFHDVGVQQGVALGVHQTAQASMGVDWADYDRDGRLDLVNSAFSNESYSLYRNNGAYFENMSTRLGIADATAKRLGFGAKFADVDNDGWPDILFANGHVYDAVHAIDPQVTFKERMQLFMNRSGHRFEEASASAGPPFQQPILGRGLASGDYDDDGRVHFLVVDYDSSPLLLHNETAPAGQWLELELHGKPPNMMAYGARVTVRSGSDRWIGQVSPASSYLSSSSPLLHFGLGSHSSVDRIDIRWLDGRTESIRGGPADRRIIVQEGVAGKAGR